MSVLIVFPDGSDWFKANWVFRQLKQDVSGRYRRDAEICKALDVAEALGTLDLKKMENDLCRRLMEALSVVATDTINGSIAGWRPHDAKEHSLYCQAVSELTKRREGKDAIDASAP